MAFNSAASSKLPVPDEVQLTAVDDPPILPDKVIVLAWQIDTFTPADTVAVSFMMMVSVDTTPGHPPDAGISLVIT